MPDNQELETATQEQEQQENAEVEWGWGTVFDDDYQNEVPFVPVVATEYIIHVYQPGDLYYDRAGEVDVGQQTMSLEQENDELFNPVDREFW